ncbi:MAG: branched-chain amino acid transport system ATP-binding protein [Actinomycetota bacterium]|nr:branched-chain amino acid transport system ATP-binding protein [Actinomycetota bacterium]
MHTSSDKGSPPARLNVSGLAAGYGGAPIVHGVDLSVRQGQVVSVIGPNGAGKSTLLKALTGQISVMEGSVTLDGRDITNTRGDRLARIGIGYVPQTRDVFDTLTVHANLEMGGYLLPKRQVSERVDEVLRVFPQLAAMRERTAIKLSGGERKMLAVGRVLMIRPTVLLLDEPTANLSPELSRVVLHDHVRRLANEGAAVLLVEQKALEALRISDWGCVLVAGTPQIQGPAPDLLARPDIRQVFLGQVLGDAEVDGSAPSAR